MGGQFERANDEWAEAYRIVAGLEADRELCVAAFCQALALIALDPEAGLRWASESIERSRALGFTCAEGLASTAAGILHAVAGGFDTAQTRYSQALEIQQKSATRKEPACRSAASLNLHSFPVTWRVPSTFTGSLSLRSKLSMTEPRKRGSSPRWPGHICSTKTRRLLAGTSSTRCRPTLTWRAFAESGFR